VYQTPLEMLKINQNLKSGGLFSNPVAAVSLPKAMKRYPGSDLRGNSTPSENTFLSLYVKMFAINIDSSIQHLLKCSKSARTSNHGGFCGDSVVVTSLLQLLQDA
jgi:hypothetical protein